MNRPFLILATASLLATTPLAFAQDSHANGHATEHAQQSTGMQEHANMQPATPAEPAQPANKVTWSELDADKDGALSKTEAAPVDSLSQAFDSADTDKNGSLTADEYKAYLATRQQDPTQGNQP